MKDFEFIVKEIGELTEQDIIRLGGCGKHRWLNTGSNYKPCPHCIEELLKTKQQECDFENQI